MSCLGHDVDTFWKNLVNGECGIDYIEGFPTDGFEVKIGGEVRDFVPENFGMDKPFIRKQDKFTVYAVASAYQAMKDSGLVSGENIDPFRLGVYIGSGIGGFETIQREVSKILEDPTGRWISPNFVPCIIGNMAAGQVAIKFQANGPCIDVVTACATSTHAIGEAFQITGDESLTWNQIHETIAEAFDVTLRPCHVSSDFLAAVGKKYDLRGSLLGDKAVTVLFDNTKLKRLVPEMETHIRFDQGVRIARDYLTAHPELQVEDPEFDAFCDAVVQARAYAQEEVLSKL